MQRALHTCTIRSFVPDDAAALARNASDERIARWTSDRFPHPYTREHAQAFIERAGETCWAIDLGGEVVGGIALVPKDDIHRRSADIGYWLAPAYWGRGIATEAVRFACEHAFGPLDLIRVQALVFEGNDASMRVLDKCGFVLEARHRRAAVKYDRVLDELVYARLRDDTSA